MPLYLADCTNKRNAMIENVNGTTVSYEIEGEEKSRVILLHGWGCEMNMMQPVADALKNEHQVLLLDFPGHGKSGRPPEPWGVHEYAECLKELLYRTEFFPCSVIAHSFGCRVATWMAAYYPELFHKMIFTGAAGIRPKTTESAARRNAEYKKMKNYCTQIKKIPFLKSSAEHWEEKLRQKYGSRDYNALDEEMRKTFIKVINQDLSELYPKLRQSTLLIWGDADTETPLWMGREMEKLIPDAGLVIFEGGSHFAYLEQIQRFNTVAQHFLKEETK